MSKIVASSPSTRQRDPSGLSHRKPVEVVIAYKRSLTPAEAVRFAFYAYGNTPSPTCCERAKAPGEQPTLRRKAVLKALADS
jgi:hypothetical protein